MSDAFWGYLLAGAALLLFSTAILMTKAAASRIDISLGFLIAGLSNVLFSGLAFLVQLAFQSGAVSWNGRAFLLFGAAGAFSTYLGRWFFYESVVRFGPARASVFQISSPLFTALIAWLVLGERLTPLLLAGILVTLGGLVLASHKPAPAGVAGSGLTQRSSGMRPHLLQSVLLLGLGSSLAYAIGSVLRGVAVRLWNEPVLGALVGAVLGLALHLAFSPGKRGIPARLRQANRTGVALYALLGVATISAQVCAIAAMRYIPLSIASLVTLCTPVLVFPLSHLLFKNSDGVTRITLLGCGLTLLGIFIIVMR